jgi:hypothetical protein
MGTFRECPRHKTYQDTQANPSSNQPKRNRMKIWEHAQHQGTVMRRE